MPKSPEPFKRRDRGTSRTWNSTSFNYHSPAWRRLRQVVLDKDPLCVECKKKGTLTPSSVADHIRPISEGGDPWDLENLQGLCEICHNKKSAIEGNKRR